MNIYTKTGDRGETALLGGMRVSKAHPRVEAYGDVDELNALVGVARAAGVEGDVAEILDALQRDLFALGSRLADARGPSARVASKATLGAADVARLEQWIDRLDAGLPPLTSFILPGGGAAGAALHLARTVCRRAERRMVSLQDPAVEPDLLVYANRLSDLLFVLARHANHRAGVREIEW